MIQEVDQSSLKCIIIIVPNPLNRLLLYFCFALFYL